MPWPGAVGTNAERVRAAHDAAVSSLGEMVLIERVTRARAAGQGYLAKTRRTVGPIRVHVYFNGSSLLVRGQQGDDAGRQDHNSTWAASFLSSDGAALEPLASGAANGEWEFHHSVYGRFRLSRVNPMAHLGQTIGYQAGLERLG